LIDDDLDSIADMLKRRAGNPRCKPLESIDHEYTSSDWFNEASKEKQVQISRALLPFAKDLPLLNWNPFFDACFHEKQAPYLTDISICVSSEGDGYVFSCFEAAPALVSIGITVDYYVSARAEILRSINAAVRNGASQNLERLVMEDCAFGDGGI